MEEQPGPTFPIQQLLIQLHLQQPVLICIEPKFKAASAFSTATTVTVDPATVAGIVSGGSTICEGSSTGILTLSGYTGSILKWQYRYNAGAWTDIANTADTYSTTLVVSGVYEYRAQVQSGSCASAFSTATTVTVDPAVVAGTVSGTTTEICLGNPTGTMTLSGYTGSVVKWQKRVDGGAWADIATTLTTYSEIPSTEGVWDYRAEVESGACGSAYSTAHTITVDPVAVGGSIYVKVILPESLP